MDFFLLNISLGFGEGKKIQLFIAIKMMGFTISSWFGHKVATYFLYGHPWGGHGQQKIGSSQVWGKGDPKNGEVDSLRERRTHRLEQRLKRTLELNIQTYPSCNKWKLHGVSWSYLSFSTFLFKPSVSFVSSACKYFMIIYFCPLYLQPSYHALLPELLLRVSPLSFYLSLICSLHSSQRIFGNQSDCLLD